MSSDNELSVTYLLTGTPKVSFILRPLEQAKSHRLEFYATSILNFWILLIAISLHAILFSHLLTSPVSTLLLLFRRG